MALFGDDTGSLHGSTLFGRDSSDKDHPVDPWSMPSQGTSTDGGKVSRLLNDAIIPDIYTATFNNATPVAGFVSSDALSGVLASAELSDSQTENILSIISQGQDRITSIDRGTWNVAMALAGFAQRGSEELNLDLVDFARTSLPNVKIPGMDQKIASHSNANGPWGSSGNTDPLEHDTIPTSAATTEAEWQSSFDASLYNPVSKPTISLSVVPKREGTFLFRHVNYIVEGTLPSTRLDKGRFKVIRRYSDFVWLLECLQKKYPFRLLPILPPKRLADGRYLSSDQQFLERRKRGLSRFINLLVKHPLLANEKLVSIFLTVDTELNTWRSGSSLELEEEYTNRVISSEFISSWSEEQEMQRWRDTRIGTETSLETLTQLCMLADRIAKRNLAMAADYKKVSGALSAFTETIPLVYSLDSGDIPAIGQGMRNVSKFLSTSSTLAQDESQAMDIGFLEDLKLLRDTVASALELFQRYEKHGGDNIIQLENRIEANEQKLKMLKNRPEVKAGDLDKITKNITADKRSISYQRNRSWLIRETITEELSLHQRTQYLISRLIKDWSMDNLKYAELHSENWSSMNNDVSEMPIPM